MHEKQCIASAPSKHLAFNSVFPFIGVMEHHTFDYIIVGGGTAGIKSSQAINVSKLTKLISLRLRPG
jgi:hypothetical protein